VILHPEAMEADRLPEYLLLNGLGHEVAATSSAGQAVEMLQSDRADLVIIDSDRVSQTDFMAHLTGLPADQQPERVAIFTDSMDESMEKLTQQLPDARVQVLLKPMHMHGLLRILRNIEGKA
jgi:CheY-like chemotaxis protein